MSSAAQTDSQPGDSPITQSGTIVYKRILLKLSGEALQKDSLAINPELVSSIGEQIRQVRESGVQIAIVIGGGNIFRGMKAAARGMDRSTADSMGMLATVINALALQDAFEKHQVPSSPTFLASLTSSALLSVVGDGT